MGLLFMTSLGHAGSANPSQLQDLIQASHGFYAHAANIPSSGHEVIDAAQQSISHIAGEGAAMPQIVTSLNPVSHNSVSHTWTSHEIRTAFPIAQAIPEVVGWL